MHLRITTAEGIPVYQQIVNQIRHLVASGRLTPGEEVPAIRTLAEQLVVNPNTVARAYRELERAGVLATRRTAGTYVAQAPPRVAPRERLRLLRERTDALLVEARHLDVDLEDVIELLRERDAAMSPEEQRL